MLRLTTADRVARIVRASTDRKELTATSSVFQLPGPIEFTKGGWMMDSVPSLAQQFRLTANPLRRRRMPNHHRDLEENLNLELRCWLRRALNDVLALPTARDAHGWRGEDDLRAITRASASIDAARLYASECDEVQNLVHLSSMTLRIADFAMGLCRSLEEEVNFVQDELLIYAC